MQNQTQMVWLVLIYIEISQVAPHLLIVNLASINIYANILHKKIFLHGIVNGNKLLLYHLGNFLSSELDGPLSIILSMDNPIHLISEFLKTT